MTSIFHKNDGTHRAILWIDNRFQVEIRRHEGDLVLHVYPITDGEIWDHPYDTFVVDEERIIELEQEMKE
jgi:hypothetical protein